MARTQTFAEAALLAGNAYQVGRRVKVANGSGTMIDLSSWVEEVDIDIDIDQPVKGATIQFRRDAGTTQSLSPLRSDSTLNRLDDGTTYSPLLDVSRTVTIEIPTHLPGMIPGLHTNSLLWSRDLTNATAWGTSGTGSAAQNAVGVDGSANSATTLTDSGAGDFYSKSQAKAIANDGATHCLAVWIKKDTTQTRFPQVKLVLAGGTTVQRAVSVNTQTGALGLNNSAGVGTFRIVDGATLGDVYAGWWILEITCTNNSSGNTSASAQIYPAAGTVLGVDSAAATGSTVFGQVQLELNASAFALPIFTTTAAASVDDYKMLFKGEIDVVNFEKSPVSIDCRDQGCVLVDRWIESEADYGSVAGVPVENVMQQVLDATFGASFIPLFTPVSPSFNISPPYTQQKQSQMDAQLALAQLPGFDCRYKWDEGTAQERFTLYQPPRGKVIPDFTYSNSRYFEVPTFKIDRDKIRNVIYVFYFDAALNKRTFVVASDAVSIAKYKRRPFFVVEGDTSPIKTAAAANAMAAAMLSDLKDPKAEKEIEMPFYWPGELHDLIRFSPTIRSDSNQDLAVVSIRHKIGRKKARTNVRLRGSPCGAYLSWLGRNGISGKTRPGEVPPTALISIEAASRRQSTVRFNVAGGTGPHQYQWRADVEGKSVGTYSAFANLPAGGITRNFPADYYHDTNVYLIVKDSVGLVSDETNITITAAQDASDAAGSGHGAVEEEGQRGGAGGYGSPGSRYRAEPYYDETGSIPLLDPRARRVGALLQANDGEAGIESQRAATRKGAQAAGSGAHGITEEEIHRSGNGGIPVPSGRVHTLPQYDSTGTIPCFDPVTRELQNQAGLAIGFRVKPDLAMKNSGGTTSFGMNRHNDEQAAVDAAAKTFGISFDAIPQIRALPQNWTLPGTNSTVDRKIEFKATGVSAAGFTARAVYSTGSSSSPQTENPASTLNGTPVSSVTLQNPNAAAFWNLANANSVLTTYTVHYDVDTTSMDPSNIVTISIYRNDGVGSTNWTLVAYDTFGSGVSITDSTQSFDYALAANFDIRIVITYETVPLTLQRATITAKACTYDKITAGTEAALTNGAGNSILYQAMEAP